MVLLLPSLIMAHARAHVDLTFSKSYKSSFFYFFLFYKNCMLGCQVFF
jgi:hypothetical protein